MMKKNVKNFALIACFSVSLIASATGVIAVSADGTSLVSAEMVMTQGASLYLKEESGLKFQYTIANYDGGANKNYGMLIVPYDYLDDAGITDLTLNTNDYVQALQAATLPNAPIIVENLQPSEAGVVEYSIGRLIENNYAREFFGIGFEKTGENSYLYATQNDNVRSVFEVANLALNKLHFGEWDSTDEKQAAEKELLAGKEQSVLNPFITTGFEFVYGTTNPTVSVAASAVGGEVTPVIITEKVRNVELAMHWNYVSENEEIASVANGKIKGEARGQCKITASLGNALSVNSTASVLKDATELELYNNSHKANFFAEEGKISLTGGFYNSSSNNTEKVAAASVGYVAFEKEYTLDEKGTYIDVYFTGNNMPSVEFFASGVNEKFMLAANDDGKGFIVNNGMAYSSTNNDDSTARFGGWSGYNGYFAYGVSGYTNRWNGPEYYQLGVNATNDATATVYDFKNSKDTTMSYSNFSMYSLARLQDANQNYRYTVGMYKDSDGYVWLDSELYKVDNNGTETLFASFNGKAIVEGQTNSIIQEKLNEGETISGKIVLHAAVKGNVKGTADPDANVFSCSAPYVLPQHENATFNKDGTVTIQNGNGDSQAINAYTSGYIVLDDDYRLGEYVDVYFTGDNMPHMSFFAKQVTNCLDNGSTGFVMQNGSTYADGVTYYPQSAGSLLIYSPKRTMYNQDGADMTSKSLGSSHTLPANADKTHALSMYRLAEIETTTKFKMTVGFYENASGYVEMSIDVKKLNGETWTDYFVWTKASTLNAETDADTLGKYLIAYGTQRAKSSVTFSYTAPYTK
ncbi:MAG: hypothetical protein ACI4SH_09575 [Candidatus Scatosoma sp.]